MNIHTLAVTSRSITCEIDNNRIYHTEEAYNIYLNGALSLEDWTANVFSFFPLEPETKYTIEVKNQLGECLMATSEITEVESVLLDVRRFGAKGDGQHLDGPAIQAAIAACPPKGTVWIPKGTYLTGPLFLKSHTTLALAEGGVILGHTDRYMYPILPGYTPLTDESDEHYIGTWEGNPLDCHASLITGLDLVHTAIIGKGTINGNGSNGDWWVNPKVKKEAWRPRTLFMKGCRHCLVQGVTVTNSPSWTIHPYLSDHLDFLDLKVKNPKDSPNTDGLDPESSSDLRIIGVDFSVGDDCIAIKSGKLYMGRKLKRPSENFVIRNCRMRYGHGAVVIGSEVSGGARNIEVSRCLFEETDRGLRIKTRRGRGKDGIIDDIRFENIRMHKVLTPFVMNMYYFCDPDGKTAYVYSREALPLDEWTPYLGRFSFKGIDCHDAQVAAGAFYGLPEQPIEEVVMEDVSIRFADTACWGQPAMMSFAEDVSRQGITAVHVKRLSLKNVLLENYIGERIIKDAYTEIVEGKELE